MTTRRPASPRPAPAAKPAQKPAAKPAAKPAQKPAAKPAQKPTRSSARATTRPASRPSARAVTSARRPASGRGSTLLRPTTMFAAVLVLLSLLVAPSLRTWIAQRQELAAQRQAVLDLQRRVADLKAERARWNDPAYVKAQAGDRLDYVMPGQTRYTLLDDTADADADTDPLLRAEAAAQASSDLPWYGAVWQSARMAGGTSEP